MSADDLAILSIGASLQWGVGSALGNAAMSDLVAENGFPAMLLDMVGPAAPVPANAVSPVTNVPSRTSVAGRIAAVAVGMAARWIDRSEPVAGSGDDVATPAVPPLSSSLVKAGMVSGRDTAHAAAALRLVAAGPLVSQVAMPQSSEGPGPAAATPVGAVATSRSLTSETSAVLSRAWAMPHTSRGHVRATDAPEPVTAAASDPAAPPVLMLEATVPQAAGGSSAGPEPPVATTFPSPPRNAVADAKPAPASGTATRGESRAAAPEVASQTGDDAFRPAPRPLGLFDPATSRRTVPVRETSPAAPTDSASIKVDAPSVNRPSTSVATMGGPAAVPTLGPSWASVACAGENTEQNAVSRTPSTALVPGRDLTAAAVPAAMDRPAVSAELGKETQAVDVGPVSPAANDESAASLQPVVAQTPVRGGGDVVSVDDGARPVGAASPATASRPHVAPGPAALAIRGDDATFIPHVAVGPGLAASAPVSAVPALPSRSGVPVLPDHGLPTSSPFLRENDIAPWPSPDQRPASNGSAPARQPPLPTATGASVMLRDTNDVPIADRAVASSAQSAPGSAIMVRREPVAASDSADAPPAADAAVEFGRLKQALSSNTASSATNRSAAIASPPVGGASTVTRLQRANGADAGPPVTPTGSRAVVAALAPEVADVTQPAANPMSVSPEPRATASAATTNTAVTSPIEQAVTAIASLAAPKASQAITVRLDPVELGKLSIRIDRTANGPTTVRLTVEKAETLALLVGDQAHLARALDQAGVPSANRSVSFHLMQAEIADGPPVAGVGAPVAAPPHPTQGLALAPHQPNAGAALPADVRAGNAGLSGGSAGAGGGSSGGDRHPQRGGAPASALPHGTPEAPARLARAIAGIDITA